MDIISFVIVCQIFSFVPSIYGNISKWFEKIRCCIPHTIDVRMGDFNVKPLGFGFSG